MRYGFAAASLAVFSWGGPALAEAWQSGEAGNGAWATTARAGQSLRISCNPGDQSFFFILSGGPFAGMRNLDDGNESMMLWIEAPDGRTARHPIDGHYFGPEKSFVGRFVVSGLVLDQFRNGSEMRLTSPTGATVGTFGMKGTGKARGHFKEACGI